jgi:hypothetical protein
MLQVINSHVLHSAAMEERFRAEATGQKLQEWLSKLQA